MVKRVLIAFDFDHTLIDETIDTYVLKLLPDGGRLPPSVQKLYSIHEWNVYQREVFRYLHMSRITKEQLLACVVEMPLVKGMRELLEFLAMFKMAAAKAGAKSESCELEVEKRATVNGVSHNQVAENGFYAMQQQQQSVINGAGPGPVGCTRPPVQSSVAGPRSVTDGKISSPVQFDVIIVSDANSVSTFTVHLIILLLNLLSVWISF